MHIEQLVPKQSISRYFKEIRYYCFLFCSSLLLMPMPSVEAKTKKAAANSDHTQQKKGKKNKKKQSAKGEKRTCDIIAYTDLCLENPRKLAKYATFYHQGSHCIGLNINKIDITNHEDIMHNIYCGRRLKSFAKDKKKATWSLMQRYYTARSLAQIDLNIYQNYKKQEGAGSCEHGILTNLLVNAIVDTIQSARFKKQDAIFTRMLPYMVGLYAIKKQVQLSKVNLMMLGTEEPILYEPAIF